MTLKKLRPQITSIDVVAVLFRGVIVLLFSIFFSVCPVSKAMAQEMALGHIPRAIYPTFYFMWGDLTDAKSRDQGFIDEEVEMADVASRDFEDRGIKTIFNTHADQAAFLAAVRSPDTVGIVWSSHGSSYSGEMLAADHNYLESGNIADRGGNLFLFVANSCHTEGVYNQYNYALRPVITKYWKGHTDTADLGAYLTGQFQNDMVRLYKWLDTKQFNPPVHFSVRPSINKFGESLGFNDQNQLYFQSANGDVRVSDVARKYYELRAAKVKLNDDRFSAVMMGRKVFLGCSEKVKQVYRFNGIALTTDVAMNSHRDWIACGYNGVVARGSTETKPFIIASEYTGDTSKLNYNKARMYYTKPFTKCSLTMSEWGFWTVDATRIDGTQLHKNGVINHVHQSIDDLTCL